MTWAESFAGKNDLLMLFCGFFDESGKFADQSIVSFCGVAGEPKEFEPFTEEWQRALYRNGLKYLHMKGALNPSRPLSEKNPSIGIESRVRDLMPFVQCIRKHVKLVICFAVDVTAFRELSGETQRILNNDPHYTAFVKVVAEVLHALQAADKVNVVCDDEERTARPMYKLYRMLQKHYTDAREKLVCLSFADDRVFDALQAADLVASLTRLEADNRIHGKGNDYKDLFMALNTREKDDKLWAFLHSVWGAEELERTAQDIRRIKNKTPEKTISLLDLAETE